MTATWLLILLSYEKKRNEQYIGGPKVDSRRGLSSVDTHQKTFRGLARFQFYKASANAD
jgi:hypothetical protein